MKLISRKFLKLLLVITFLFISNASWSQTISTGTISGSSFCTGSAVSVPFTIAGTFNPGNVFTAQLSDASGNFSSAVNIGTLISNVAGTIYANIPSNASSGNGYRFRVVSSNPVTTGTANSSNQTIVNYNETMFQKSYSSGTGTSILSGKVIQLPDGNFVFSAFGMDIYKTDASGNLIWAKKIYEDHYYGYPSGGGYSDYSDDVQQTADGGFILGGHKIYSNNAGSNQYRIYLVKTDANGNPQWANTYGDENTGGCSGSTGTFMSVVKQTSDKGYIITGYTNDFGFGCPGKDLILKVDSNGNELWARTIDDLGVNYVYGWGAADIVEIPGGGGDLMIYAGNYPYPNPPAFGVMIRIHADGSIVWSKKFSINFNILPTRMAITPGGYYLGSTNGYGVVKVDTGGNVLWSRTFGGDYEDALAPTADSGCILTGYAYTGSPENARMIKVSKDGNLEWVHDYGSGGSLEGQTVVQTKDGGYLVAGNKGGIMYLIKTDNLGNSGGNQSTPTLTTTDAGGATTDYTPTFTSRVADVLPACTVSSDLNTTVTSIITSINCNSNEINYTNSVCSAFPISVNSNGITCNSNNGSATVSPSGGIAPYSYHWSNGETTKTVSGLSYGNYTVTVTDYSGSTTIGSASISQSSSPLKLSGTADTSVCPGQNVALSVSGASSYSWFPAAGLSVTTGSGVSASPVITTTYTVVGTAGGCADSLKIIVAVNSLPVAGVVSANIDSVCTGGTTVLAVSGSSGIIQWQSSTDGILFSNITGASSLSYTSGSLSQPTYFRTEVYSGGCGPDSSTPKIISVLAPPIAGNVSSVKDTICQGTITHLQLEGNSTGTIQWQSSDSTTGFNDIQGATGTTYTSDPLTHNTYFRAIVNTKCADTTTAFKITTVPAPVAAYTSTDSAYVVTFNSSGSIGVTDYSWDFGDSTSGTDANPIHNYPGAGTYYVCLTVKNSTNCNYKLCKDVIVAPTGINEISNGGMWVAYPDPVNNILFINGPLSNKEINGIEIDDVLGRIILKREVKNPSTPFMLDVSELSKGIYYLKIKTNNNDFTLKVIKQ